MNLLSSISKPKCRTGRSKSRRGRKSLGIESLECRDLMTATAWLDDGNLRISADDEGGRIEVNSVVTGMIDPLDPTGGLDFNIRVTGSSPGGNMTAEFDTFAVNKIIFFGSNQRDIFFNRTSIDTWVYGYNGNDYLSGGSGMDTIWGGQGSDTVLGGNGNDYVYGNQGVDTLRGGNGNDVLAGHDSTDYLYGEAGDDRLWGHDGDDRMYGQQGTDTLYGGNGVDRMSGGDGNDRLYGENDGDYLWGNNQNDTLIGGSGNDYLDGGNQRDRLYGQDGADRLVGGSDVDILYGGYGNDELRGGFANDYLYGQQGDDTLHGDEGHDVLFGDDYVNSYTDDGSQWETPGNIKFRGGADTLFGESGSDVLHGGGGDDVLEGGAQNDRLYGNHGNDTLRGDDGQDVLFGQLGDDNLYGGGGTDQLYGHGGHDGLYGGGEGDDLWGGAGADRFLLQRPRGGSASTALDNVHDYRSSDDARIFFEVGRTQNVTLGSNFGTVRALAGVWSHDDIERVDDGFDMLVDMTGSTRLLKRSGGGAMIFERIGTVRRLNSDGTLGAIVGNVGGWNTGNRIVLPNNAFVGGGLSGTVVHEIGHYWDQPSENSFARDFRDAGGWRRFGSDGPGESDPRDSDGSDLYDQANDGNWAAWWFRVRRSDPTGLDGFARNYGKMNPLEDFATAFTAYVMSGNGRTYGLETPATIRWRMSARFAVLDDFFASIA